MNEIKDTFVKLFNLNQNEDKIFFVIGAHIKPNVDESTVFDEFKQMFRINLKY